MGRTKGSKNRQKKDITQFNKPIVKARQLEEKGKEDKFKLKVEGVAPRKESPEIPSVLVDGGMLYRFLLELRRDYDAYIQQDKDEDVKISKKRAVQVIDVIMEYIMRMKKVENNQHDKC